MSDKVRQMTNRVTLNGVLAELEVKKGVTKQQIPYVSVKGVVQFGEHKAQTRNFEKFVQQYNINKETKAQKENKNYATILAWADKAKSLASLKAGETATEVKIQGSFAPNDYVNNQNKLIEGLKIDAAFFNDLDSEYKATADIEGYINTIVPETKGEDSVETGRLRVTLITNDFFGNVVPIKNIIVPAELRDDFESAYSVGQTAKFFIDFILHKGEEKPKKSGGIGVQRTTDGASYVEMILTGADPALDEDDEKAYSREAVKIGLAERKTKLDELVEAGYQGGNNTSKNNAAPSSAKPTTTVSDEDMPF